MVIVFWVVVAVVTVVVVSGITRALQEINCSITNEGIPIYQLGRFRVSPKDFLAMAVVAVGGGCWKRWWLR